MSVVQPPGSSPTLFWVNQRHRLRNRVGDRWGLRVGDRMVLHCLSEDSFPAANLRFYINDERVLNTTLEFKNKYFLVAGQWKDCKKSQSSSEHRWALLFTISLIHIDIVFRGSNVIKDILGYSSGEETFQVI